MSYLNVLNVLNKNSDLHTLFNAFRRPRHTCLFSFHHRMSGICRRCLYVYAHLWFRLCLCLCPYLRCCPLSLDIALCIGCTLRANPQEFPGLIPHKLDFLPVVRPRVPRVAETALVVHRVCALQRHEPVVELIIGVRLALVCHGWTTMSACKQTLKKLANKCLADMDNMLGCAYNLSRILENNF